MADAAVDATPPTALTEEVKPAVAEIKRLGDEPEASESTASSSSAKSVSELNVGALSIDEDKKVVKFLKTVIKFLEDPEESNIQAVTSGETPYTSATTFEELNLSPELLKGLYVEMNFQKPSRIQAISLPMILTPPHKDLIAQAHNGSGKTTCFVLGMLSRVDPLLKRPQALCICPTRELSIQNYEVLTKMGKYTSIECGLRNERDSMGKPVTAQVVIGTPGTILKLISYKKLGISDMKVLVFDEADHMLAKEGFQDDSQRIINAIKKQNDRFQVLLFSATFDDAVKNFASRVVKDGYNQLFVKKEELSLEAVKQYKVFVPDEQAKIMVIKDRILELGERVGQTIIFVKEKRSAIMLHHALLDLGYEVTSIHGSLTHEERDKIVKEFKDGLTQVLISTDLLARGFDQQQINLVVNYDLPVKYPNRSEPQFEVYLHRIGRAGRFGCKGAVFNLIMTDEEEMIMERIEKYFNTQVVKVPSWNNDEDFKNALKAAGLL